MIGICLALVVLCGLEAFMIWELSSRQAEDASYRQRRIEAELLSVLGKTETVAIALSDERPKAQVRYMTEADEVEAERSVA